MPQKMKYDLYTEGVSVAHAHRERSLTGGHRLTAPLSSLRGGTTNLRKYGRGLMNPPI